MSQETPFFFFKEESGHLCGMLAHHETNAFNNMKVVDDLEELFQWSGRDESWRGCVQEQMHWE